MSSSRRNTAKEERKSLISNAAPIDNRNINYDSQSDLESEKYREIGEIFPDGLTSNEAAQR